MNVDSLMCMEDCFGQVPIVVAPINKPLGDDMPADRCEAAEAIPLAERILMSRILEAKQKLLHLPL